MLLNTEKWLNVLVHQAHGVILGAYWGEVKKQQGRRWRLARGERVMDR